VEWSFNKKKTVHYVKEPKNRQSWEMKCFGGGRGNLERGEEARRKSLLPRKITYTRFIEVRGGGRLPKQTWKVEVMGTRWTVAKKLDSGVKRVALV